MPPSESISTENREFIILQKIGVDGLIEDLTWLYSNIRDFEDLSDLNFIACSTWMAEVIRLSNQAYTLKELSDCAVAMLEAERIFKKFYLFLNKTSPKASKQHLERLQQINDNILSQVEKIIKNIDIYMAVGYMTTGLTSEKNRTFYTEEEIKTKLIPIPDDTRSFWKLFWDNITRFEIKSDSVLYLVFFATVFSTAVLLSIISFPISVPTLVTTVFFSLVIFQAIKFPFKIACANLVNRLLNKKVTWGHPVTQELIDQREKLQQQKELILAQMENHSLKKQLSTAAEKTQELEKMLKHEKDQIAEKSKKQLSYKKVLFNNTVKKAKKNGSNHSPQRPVIDSRDPKVHNKNLDPKAKPRDNGRVRYQDRLWKKKPLDKDVPSLLAGFSKQQTSKEHKQKKSKKPLLETVTEVSTTPTTEVSSSLTSFTKA